LQFSVFKKSQDFLKIETNGFSILKSQRFLKIENLKDFQYIFKTVRFENTLTSFVSFQILREFENNLTSFGYFKIFEILK